MIDSPSLVLADYAASRTNPARACIPPMLSAIIGRELDAIRLVRAHIAAGYNGAFVIPADPSKPARKVMNLGWLIRHRDDVMHPAQGVAFTVRTWAYNAQNRGSYGYVPRETFSPIMLARMADGSIYATQWADASVLIDWLDRPSFRGYLLDYDDGGTSSIPTCAIGGRDFAAIPEHIAARRARKVREREIAARGGVL